MSKAAARSTVYRLIEAGQRAHRALLVPLLDRGLEPGDDAILLVIGGKGATEAELGEATGLDGAALEQRILPLIARDLLRRHALGSKLGPGLALTERGLRIHDVLQHHWRELENALFGELKKKDRRRFSRILARFVQLLRL